MKEYVDSALAYGTGIMLLAYSQLLAYSDEIMTVGGIVLLAARLYVDGGQAIRTWRHNRGRKGK